MFSKILLLCSIVCSIASPILRNDSLNEIVALIRYPTFGTRIDDQKDKWLIQINGVVQKLTINQLKTFRKHFIMATNDDSIVSVDEAHQMEGVLGKNLPPQPFYNMSFHLQGNNDAQMDIFTANDGTFSQEFIITNHESSDYTDFLRYDVSEKVTKLSLIDGRVELIEPIGFSIISDIDDTIKVSGTNVAKLHLKYHYQCSYIHVQGMPELYLSLLENLTSPDVLNHKPSFHYVSGAHVDSLPSLQYFIEQKAYFPEGSYHLKFEALDTYNHKMREVDSIISRLSNRKFVLFGDSTMKDANVYAEQYEKYPNNVACIFIRLVFENDSLEQQIFLNSKERFNHIFKKVPRNRWMVFTHPNQIPSAVDIMNLKCNSITAKIN